MPHFTTIISFYFKEKRDVANLWLPLALDSSIRLPEPKPVPLTTFALVDELRGFGKVYLSLPSWQARTRQTLQRWFSSSSTQVSWRRRFTSGQWGWRTAELWKSTRGSFLITQSVPIKLASPQAAWLSLFYKKISSVTPFQGTWIKDALLRRLIWEKMPSTPFWTHLNPWPLCYEASAIPLPQASL